MKKSVLHLWAKYALVIALLLNSITLPAQWVKKADAGKLRSELGETIIYNGKLYAFVGFSDTDRHAELSSEVYDPETDSWAPLASMPANTAMTHQDIVLIDNTVWHIGGRVGQNPGPMSSAIWIYNITANSWSRGPEIRDPATGKPLVIAASGSALLGRVLHIFGGFTPTACTSDQDKYHLTLDVDTWLSDPSSPAQWENKLSPLPLKRNHLSALTLGGKIYAIGGQTDHDCGSLGKDGPYCHVYNPTTDSWKQLPSLPTGRSHAEGSTFAIDGKIYLVGGQGSDGKSSKYVTIFDPEGNNGAGTWSENSSLTLPYVYEGFSAAIIGTTFILSHGSQGTSKYPLKSTYSRTIARNPVYKLGFPSECIHIRCSSGTTIKGHTWLYTIDGTKDYITSSNASWLTVSKNATGTANPSAVDIEITANTDDLSPGTYDALVTATGTGSGNNYIEATLCVSLTVLQGSGTLQYNLTATANGNGTITKSPDQVNYDGGTNVTVMAIPAAGQQFTGWSGSFTGTVNPLQVVMNSNTSVIATFTAATSPPQFTLSITTSGSGNVKTNPTKDSYNNGATVTLTAIPASGQQFTGWSGSANGSANPLTITMNSSRAIAANFQQLPLITKLTTSSKKSYVISQLKTGVTFYTDRSYHITTVPDFINLSSFIKTPNEDKSSKSSSLVQFTLTQKATVYIAFDPRATALPSWLKGWQKSNATLGITDDALNHLSLYGKVYSAGKVTIGGNMVSPSAGSRNNYLIIAVAQSVQYNLMVNTNGNGTVTKDPDQPAYINGATVTLTAIPAAGQQFAGWSGAETGTTNPLAVTMNAAKTVTANFSAVEYGLTVNINGDGSVAKSPDKQSYKSGSTVILTATPGEGQQFNGWSGDISGTTNPVTLTMDEAKTITADFSVIKYGVTISINGNGSVTKSPDKQNYNSGSIVTLTATPDEGQQFTGWSDDGEGEYNLLTLLMDADKMVTATFAPVSLSWRAENKTVNTERNIETSLKDKYSGAILKVYPTPFPGEIKLEVYNVPKNKK